MPITRKGLIMMLVGLALMVLGYILMTGGGSSDPQVFNYAMFDFRRLVLAPVSIVAGIIVIIVAIIRKPKEGEN
ncbi:MAG: DUF3098 domain-containing protein [Candidatus Cryptobacteroides sp.]